MGRHTAMGDELERVPESRIERVMGCRRSSCSTEDEPRRVMQEDGIIIATPWQGELDSKYPDPEARKA